MTYNAEIVRNRYDNYGDREWNRLEQDAHGILLYEVHMEILMRYIRSSDHLLDLGSGSGRYTKDMAGVCSRLTVADISSHQIECNKQKMKELGKYDLIDSYHVIDMIDMNVFKDSTFDTVVCIGAPLSYLMDREEDGVKEMLRVTRPGGTIIVGVMSLIGGISYYFKGVAEEKNSHGINATKWMLDTGVQDGIHYPSESQHYCHMFRSIELDALFSKFNVEVIEKSSAGLFTIADSYETDYLETVRKEDPELWDLLVQKEIEYTKYPGTLDCGMNIIYVLRKLEE